MSDRHGMLVLPRLESDKKNKRCYRCGESDLPSYQWCTWNMELARFCEKCCLAIQDDCPKNCGDVICACKCEESALTADDFCARCSMRDVMQHVACKPQPLEGKSHATRYKGLPDGGPKGRK